VTLPDSALADAARHMQLPAARVLTDLTGPPPAVAKDR
jgi:hypothetical protein